MDFVALISGGKDSCYNVLQCIANGHHLICIANLSPPATLICQEDRNEELHSFMYQSAGSSIIPAYEQCFGVPLIIHEIQGKAVDTSMHYAPPTDRIVCTEKDEVEDLYQLLRRVVKIFPSIKGVSCGAIVSNYQRLRVENVCERLGLTALCYLWQQDRKQLLSDLIDDGIDAILVKVAGAGLDPYKHLGKSLKTLQPGLLSLHYKFGLDLCGEGGEYESIVLDAPFFKKRIVIDEFRIFVDDEDNTVGNLKITRHSIAEKDPSLVLYPERKLSLSQLLEVDLYRLSSTECLETYSLDTIPQLMVENFNSVANNIIVREAGSFINYPVRAVSFTSMFSPTYSSVEQDISLELIRSQVQDVMGQLINYLHREKSDIKDVIYVHLYIRNMKIFDAVNDEYCKYFARHPPSRSCIMANLPIGCAVALDVVYLRGSYESASNNETLRQVLHVKAMSDWAPVCIGPYAQCNSVLDKTLIFVAGQIPLDPSTMLIRSTQQRDRLCSASLEIMVDEIKLDILLSAKHTARILNTQSSSLRRSLTLILYINTSHLWNQCLPVASWSEYLKPFLLSLAMSSYSLQLEEVIPNQYTSNSIFADDILNAEQEDWDVQEDSPVKTINNYYKNGIVDQYTPVVVLVGVPGLPRNASIEIEAIATKEGVLTTGFALKKKIIPQVDHKFFTLLDLSVSPHCMAHGSLSVVLVEHFEVVPSELIIDVAMFLGSTIIQSVIDKYVQLSLHVLKSIRIYFVSDKVGEIEYIHNLFSISFCRVGLTEVSLSFIPCCQLEGEAIFTCIFHSIDFEQLEANQWIQNLVA